MLLSDMVFSSSLKKYQNLTDVCLKAIIQVIALSKPK